jgi:hypothetical protein
VGSLGVSDQVLKREKLRFHPLRRIVFLLFPLSHNIADFKDVLGRLVHSHLDISKKLSRA